jgi:hypothetical protein
LLEAVYGPVYSPLALRSVTSLLTATLYQGSHDRNVKHWNITSTDRYISINTESIFPPLSPAMILYQLLFHLVWLSPVASDWPWSYS